MFSSAQKFPQTYRPKSWRKFGCLDKSRCIVVPSNEQLETGMKGLFTRKLKDAASRYYTASSSRSSQLS